LPVVAKHPLVAAISKGVRLTEPRAVWMQDPVVGINGQPVTTPTTTWPKASSVENRRRLGAGSF